MTIDENIENLVLLKKLEDSLGNISGNTNSAVSQSLGFAIDIMRKYQKIEQIMKKRYGRYHIEIVQEIKEVIEDGKDKSRSD